MLFSAIPVSLVAGAATWSFAEYALHNWYGHLPKGKNRFSRQHLSHHADNRYFAPTSHKVIGALAAIATVGPLVSLLVGPVAGVSFAVGLAAAYGTYEVMHRRAHTHAPKTRYGRWQRKHHFHHHFGAPKKNHGVTSPLFDMVFGTHEPVSVVRVPERHAMDWLLDAKTGDVAEAYRQDYVLVRRGQRKSEAEDRRAAFANHAPAA